MGHPYIILVLVGVITSSIINTAGSSTVDSSAAGSAAAVASCDDVAGSVVTYLNTLAGMFYRRKLRSFSRQHLHMDILSRADVSSAICPILDATSLPQFAEALNTTGTGLNLMKILYGLTLGELCRVAPFLSVPTWWLKTDMVLLQANLENVFFNIDHLHLRQLDDSLVSAVRGIVKDLTGYSLVSCEPGIAAPAISFRSSLNQLLQLAIGLQHPYPEFIPVMQEVEYELAVWGGPQNMHRIVYSLAEDLDSGDVHSVQDLYEALKVNHVRNFYYVLQAAVNNLHGPEGRALATQIRTTNFSNLL